MSRDEQVAASSSPADVVRLYIKTEYPPQPASQAANQAEDALDALEAENVRLREALEQITQVWPNRGHAANIAREALYG